MSALHRSTPAELKARLEAERRGAPFLLYFDGAGHQVLHELDGQVTVGRGAECDVALGWDREVSRLHAQLERVGGQCRRRAVAQRLVRQRRAGRRATRAARR